MAATIFTFQRYEMKYILNQDDLDFLLPIIKAHMQPDAYPHYRIRSWYYDTPTHQVRYENLQNPKWKSKLRYRIYCDAVDSPQFLELKCKCDGLTYKRRIKVSSFGGALDEAREGNSQIAKEIAYFDKVHPGLAPSIAITYDRYAFHEDATDLRLTIDSDVFAGVVPLIDSGRYIMEAKVPLAIPKWLLYALEQRKLYRCSFSKFSVGSHVSSAMLDASEIRNMLLNELNAEKYR